MAAVAHPPETQQSTGPTPAPLPSCPRRPWAALLFSALGAELPRGGAGRAARGGARVPGPRAYARVRTGSTCARPYWMHCPSRCLRAGAAAAKEARAEPGLSPCPGGAPGAELARGDITEDARERYNAQRLQSRFSRSRALPPRHTPPCRHPESSPGDRRRPQPSWPKRRRREGGRRSGARRRPQGSRRGGGGQGGRREDGAASLLEH